MFGGNRRISVRCHRRSRLPLMKPRWVIVCVLLVCLVLLFTCYFIYDPVAAYLFVSKFVPNPVIGRDFRGDEISSRAVIREFLNASQHHSKTPKTAFLFFIFRIHCLLRCSGISFSMYSLDINCFIYMHIYCYSLVKRLK